MNKRRNDKYERELRDPALSAMLKDTFANDPALANSPGRTERIMRMVLAAEKKPVRRPTVWAPLGWAAAALTTAVFIVALAIGTIRLPSSLDNQQVAVNPVPPVGSPTVNRPRHSPEKQPEAIATVPLPDINVQNEQPLRNWDRPRMPEKSKVAKVPVPKNMKSTTSEPQNAVRVAAALYDAGSAAHAAGDLQAAYQAYQASYAAMPTSDAILASSDVLERMADEALSDQQGS